MLALVVPASGAATEARLIEAAAPVYPERAPENGVTGWVRVSYRVMEAGAVVDPKVEANCAWQVPRYTSRQCKDKPDTRFDQAALNAVYRYRYEPATDDNGSPVSSERRAIVRFDFDPRADVLLRKLYSGEEWELAAIPYARVHMSQADAKKVGKARAQIESGNPKEIARGVRAMRKLARRTDSDYVRAVVLLTVAIGELVRDAVPAAAVAIEEALATDSGHRQTERKTLQFAIARYAGPDWDRMADLIDWYHINLRYLTLEGLLLKSLGRARAGRGSEVRREVLAANRVGTKDPHLRQLLAAAGRVAQKPSDEAVLDQLGKGADLLLALIASDGRFEPSRVEPAWYPRQAQQENLSGWVTLRYTVTKAGNVKEVLVVGNCATTVPLSERPCRNKPNDIFDTAATKAVLKWQYEPRMFGGEAVDVPGVEHTMTFDLHR